MKQYNQTSIDNEVVKILTEKYNYSWQADFTPLAVKTLFEGTAIYLGEKKSKEHPVAAVLTDASGNFKFAAIVTFIPNEEDPTKGSYNLAYTFNEEDVTKDMQQVGFNDPVLHSILADISLSKFDLVYHTYDGQEFIIPTMCSCADAIKEYMRANVQVDPKMALEDFFEMEAQLDGNKVYISITPSPVLKQHVKDDASIEDMAA